MQPIPTPITQINIRLYQGDTIAEEVVWTDGTGTYSVGTLATSVFYNLGVASGTAVNGGPVVGKRYVATYVDAHGQRGQTPWMTCMRGGDRPNFGRTMTLGEEAESKSAQGSDLVYMIELEDASVAAAHPKTEPIELVYIEGASVDAKYSGPLDAQWSVGARGGSRTNPLKVGDEVVIRGKDRTTGQERAIPAVLETVAVEDNAAGFRSKS